MKSRSKFKKSRRYLLFGFIVFLLVIIMPDTSAAYPIAPIIDRGATIYIGEEGLNLTHALNRAGGLDGVAVDTEVPTNWTIGWWAAAVYMYKTPPSKMLDISSRYRNFTVALTDFAGYAGYWYLVDPATNTSVIGSDGKPRVVFMVRDPQLDIRVWDFDTASDVTGKSVRRGDSLGFRIDTNMYGALNDMYRSPVYGDTSLDGYIDIIVKNESTQLPDRQNSYGTIFIEEDSLNLNHASGPATRNNPTYTYTKLADRLNTPRNLLRQNVSSASWMWGDSQNPTSPFPWATGVEDGGGQPVYDTVTYTVMAESRLNNMKENYKQGGPDYTGKTVSQSWTVTLVNETVKIESDHKSVLRGDRFSVTITGKPQTAYYLWIYNTGTMTGAPDDQPPTILVSAPVYQDPYDGPYIIGTRSIIGAGGKRITENVPRTTENVSKNEYYAKVVTSSSGTAVVEIQTSPETKPGSYTIRTESNSFYDDVEVKVSREIQPVTIYPGNSNVIFHPEINPEVPAPVNNDLKRITRGGTIFIGEEGLDVSEPVASADALAVPSPSPQGTHIGWWAAAAWIMTTAPSKTIDLAGRETGLRVSAADFVGYTGTWYLVDPSTGMAAKDSKGSPIPVLYVADPSLDVRIMDVDTSADVTGKSAPLGDRLTFRITTNMYEAFNSASRPDITDRTPGFMTIILKTPENARLNYLYQDNTTTHSLVNLPVNTQPWTWGGSGNQYYWDTSLPDRNYYSFYPAGTYSFWVESSLNNMKNNYKQGGADYTGKTLSQTYTVDLIPEPVKIALNRASVPRGQRFSVTLTGKPNTSYYFWVSNTGNMTGASGNQPPTILVSAPVFQDPYNGPYTIGAHTIIGAGGKTILGDVPSSTETVSRNEYYAKVVTSSSGIATVEFQTSSETNPGTYMIRAENNVISGEVTVSVSPDILPGPAYPDTERKVIYHPLINTDGPAPANNDLKRISRGGTIFIGEEGLDISEPFASANALAVPALTPPGTRLGWWANGADVKLTSPSKTIDLAGQETRFMVAHWDFIGYYNNWYLVDPSTGGAAFDSGGLPIPVFNVQEPSLDIRIWDIDTNTDVSGKSVPQGERLTFRIDTNIYQATDNKYRPYISGSTPGPITLIVKNEGNARYNYLYQNNTLAHSLLNQRVEIPPYFWGGGVPTTYYWATDLRDRYHGYFYQAGTYTVCAESTLNNMKANYRQGGADYTGKTVSPCYTITIGTERITNKTNKQAVTRGGLFPVTFPDRLKYLNITIPRAHNVTIGDWNDKGNSLFLLGRYQEALDAYGKALSIDPDRVNVSCNVGNMLGRLGRYQEALNTYDKALSIDPGSVCAWAGKGDILGNLGRNKDALEAYDNALSLDPASVYAWTWKGATLNKLYKFQDALGAENKALSINPNYTNAWIFKGNSLSSMGRYQEALDVQDRVLAIEPENEFAWANKGGLLGYLGQYDEALAATNKALEINPNSTTAQYNKPYLFSKTGINSSATRTSVAITLTPAITTTSPGHS